MAERCAHTEDRAPACEPCDDQVLRNRIRALERKVDRLERMVDSPVIELEDQRINAPTTRADLVQRKPYAVDPLNLDALRGNDSESAEKNVEQLESTLRVTNLGTLLDVLA